MKDKNYWISCPSRLYHLKPLGLGTPNVESLTGYIKRLAEAHRVSVGNLIVKEIIPSVRESTSFRWSKNDFLGKDAMYLNSFHKLSKVIVQTLEEKTYIDDLGYLTMDIWQDFISSMYMFREYQAWCPICFEESLESGQIIYEQLLWNLKNVEICKKHGVKLADKCPYCHSQISTLSFSSRVGYCYKCQSWLGLKKNDISQNSFFNSEWHDWFYDGIGQLLALAPTLENVKESNFSGYLNNLISVKKFSLRYIEEELDVSHGTVSKWLKGTKPLLKDALNVSYRTEYSLIDIFTKEIIPVNGLNEKKLVIKPRNNKRKIEIEKLKKVIYDETNKGISFSELSKVTGVSKKTIKKQFPNEVIILKDQYTESLKITKMEKLNLIANTIRSLYLRGIYPSMKALKRELGKRVIINDAERLVWVTTLKELGCTSEDGNKL